MIGKLSSVVMFGEMTVLTWMMMPGPYKPASVAGTQNMMLVGTDE